MEHCSSGSDQQLDPPLHVGQMFLLLGGTKGKPLTVVDKYNNLLFIHNVQYLEGFVYTHRRLSNVTNNLSHC